MSEFRFYPLKKLLSIDGDALQREGLEERGNVEIDQEHLGIFLDRRMRYLVLLDRIPNHAELIDWVFHLQPKGWVTPETLTDFLIAFELAFKAHFGCSPRLCESWNWQTKEFVERAA